MGYRSYYGYGLGHYGGYRGYYGYGKRSADAEPAATADADADAWYRSYYGHGLGYYGGYRGYYGYGLGHYGGYRGYYGYGKRSADAEPTADADASADPWF